MKHEKEYKRIRHEVETVFKVDLENRSRKRIYINARTCYYYNCLVFKEVKLTFDNATSLIGYNHASMSNLMLKREEIVNKDGFKKLHDIVYDKLASPEQIDMKLRRTSLTYYLKNRYVELYEASEDSLERIKIALEQKIRFEVATNK